MNKYTVMLLTVSQSWEGVEAETVSEACVLIQDELGRYLDYLDGEYALIATEEDEYEEEV